MVSNILRNDTLKNILTGLRMRNSKKFKLKKRKSHHNKSAKFIGGTFSSDKRFNC